VQTVNTYVAHSDRVRRCLRQSPSSDRLRVPGPPGMRTKSRSRRAGGMGSVWITAPWRLRIVPPRMDQNNRFHFPLGPPSTSTGPKASRVSKSSKRNTTPSPAIVGRTRTKCCTDRELGQRARVQDSGIDDTPHGFWSRGLVGERTGTATKTQAVSQRPGSRSVAWVRVSVERNITEAMS
jgi:hypothetical protein